MAKKQEKREIERRKQEVELRAKLEEQQARAKKVEQELRKVKEEGERLGTPVEIGSVKIRPERKRTDTLSKVPFGGKTPSIHGLFPQSKLGKEVTWKI